MHKKILLICLTFLLVGCTRTDKTEDYMALINNCLSIKADTNDVSIGYKYYVPKGIRKINDYDYNQVFLANNTKIYLYVDIISYYYKKELQYEKNDNSIYNKKINYNGKIGYIDVSKKDKDYFIKIVYNYSKIEVYTDENNINKMITLSSIILNSITYNDKIIENVLEGDFGEFRELTYEIEKPSDASNNFSQYLEEYVQKEEKEEKEKKEEKLPDK